MTSEFISKRCGNITIQLTNSMAPQTPLFSPITREVTGYRQTKTNNTRPLMYPEEVLQLDNKECLLLIRGQKPLKGLKIIPEELSAYKELEFTRVSDYIPKWRDEEEKTQTKRRETEKEEHEIYKPENTKKEDTIDYEVYKNITPNFGSNHNSERPVQIRIEEEAVFDSSEYTETDADDVLNE